MVIFFSGVTFNQVIKEVAESEEQVLFPTEISNEIDFLKTVRQNITKYGSVDVLILDESACKNTEDELIKALEMLRTMYDGMKIIVFAPYREDGDDFLTRCFQMGILNIINTDDFLEIREELRHCIREGKTLEELTMDEFKQYSDLFAEDVYTAIDLTTCCEGRTSYGGPTKASVLKQIELVKAKLG